MARVPHLYYLSRSLLDYTLPAKRKDVDVVKARRLAAALLGALALLCLACPVVTWLALKGLF